MWPNELSKPWPLGIVSFVKPRCHLPTCPVTYPPAFIISANVTCAAGIPAFPLAEETLPGTPARCGNRPVIKAALDGEQTGAAA